MAKYFYFLCTLLISVSLIILGFTSCSGSNTIATSSSRRTSTSRNTSSSSSDDKEKDDGDPCKGSDSCEETCDRIYGDYSEIQACEDEGRDKVGRLDKVFKHLKSGNYSELEDISEEDNDVDLDDFEEYLEIGVTGWTTLIQSWGAPDKANDRGVNTLNNRGKLTDTLKWIIDKTNVAEILQDIDNGLDVLETLLMEFDQLVLPSEFNPTGGNKNNIYIKDDLQRYQNCDSNDLHNYHTGQSSANVDKLYILIKSPDNANSIYCTGANAGDRAINGVTASRPANANSVKIIEFDSDTDRRLYRGLAYISLSGDNVFSYANDEGKDTILTMAYDLLNKACSDIDGDNDESIACKRSLFCWMDIKGLSNNNLDTWVENQSGLDGFDITEDCNPEGFYEFF